MAMLEQFSSEDLDALLSKTRARGRRRVTRRRTWAGACGLAVALAVAVPAYLAAGAGSGDDVRTIATSGRRVVPTTVTSAPAEPRTPTQIVVVEADGGRIAVLSAASGETVRVLAATQAGNPTLAVTPDGGTVYFTNVRQPTRGECSPLLRGEVDEVARVSIRGGPVTVVGPGQYPAVSPDGRLLAYSRNVTNPCAGNDDELVLVDLNSGTRRTLGFRRPPTSLSHLEQLSWAPDSVHLGYNQYSAESPTSPKLIDTATAGMLDDAVPIPHVANSDWAGFLGASGAIGATQGSGSFKDPATIVALDPITGAVTRTLFIVRGGLAVSNAGDGPEGTLQADRSGRDVLALGLLPINAPIRHGALYRWHIGDRRPTLVADQIWAAEWIEPNR